MYQEPETKISYKYLREVIKNLKEPICILGGWGVFFHVNKKFKKIQGRNYLGSRDIDLGFHLNKNYNIEEMKNSSLASSLSILQHKLDFKPISFRLFKEIHNETEEELEKGHKIPAHLIFPMYIDPLVDFIPKKFKEVFGFQPIDEPLLRFVFENSNYRTELKEFNRKLWLPNTELLLATKINALKARDKEHKKVKDICDIFVLIWYGNEIPITLRNKIAKFMPLKNIKKILLMIEDEDYQKAGLQVNHNVNEIKRVIALLIGK